MRAKPGAIGAIVRAYGVPEGWQMKQLGDLAKVVGGATPSRDENRFWSGGTTAWASPTDLTGQQTKRIEHTADYITEAGFQSCSTSLLPVGTILYTSRATIGAKAIAAIPITTNQGFANFIPNDEVTSEFLYYYLDLLTPVFIRLGAGTQTHAHDA